MSRQTLKTRSRILGILFVGCTLVQLQCSSSQTIRAEKLVGAWNHSREEEKNEVRVFRPEGYELPRARGRERIEFLEEGRVEYHSIAPMDGYIKKRGRFTLHVEKRTLMLIFDSKDEEPMTFEVLELNEFILRLRQM